jgi:hypothetical protein
MVRPYVLKKYGRVTIARHRDGLADCQMQSDLDSEKDCTLLIYLVRSMEKDNAIFIKTEKKLGHREWKQINQHQKYTDVAF